MPTVLWLSDLHLDADDTVLGCDPVAACERAVSFLVTHYPDADCCVVSGDIANSGSVADYRAARHLLDRLPMPWYPLVGNHDARAPLRDTIGFPGSATSDFVQYCVDLEPGRTGAGNTEVGTDTPTVRLLCLDTLIPGESGGELCAARLEWLARTLADSHACHVVVFMHHPPVQFGITPFDEIGLRNADETMAILAGHSCVRHVCAGHVHRVFTGNRHGVPFATQRSVLFQAPPARPPWDFDTFQIADEPAGFGVIHIDRNGVQIDFNQLPSP
ncbi:MAG: metallophosphoesterase [Pseudomonadota bacterium]